MESCEERLPGAEKLVTNIETVGESLDQDEDENENDDPELIQIHFTDERLSVKRQKLLRYSDESEVDQNSDQNLDESSDDSESSPPPPPPDRAKLHDLAHGKLHLYETISIWKHLRTNPHQIDLILELPPQSTESSESFDLAYAESATESTITELKATLSPAQSAFWFRFAKGDVPSPRVWSLCRRSCAIVDLILEILTKYEPLYSLAHGEMMSLEESLREWSQLRESPERIDFVLEFKRTQLEHQKAEEAERTVRAVQELTEIRAILPQLKSDPKVETRAEELLSENRKLIQLFKSKSTEPEQTRLLEFLDLVLSHPNVAWRNQIWLLIKTDPGSVSALTKPQPDAAQYPDSKRGEFLKALDHFDQPESRVRVVKLLKECPELVAKIIDEHYWAREETPHSVLLASRQWALTQLLQSARDSPDESLRKSYWEVPYWNVFDSSLYDRQYDLLERISESAVPRLKGKLALGFSKLLIEFGHGRLNYLEDEVRFWELFRRNPWLLELVIDGLKQHRPSWGR